MLFTFFDLIVKMTSFTRSDSFKFVYLSIFASIYNIILFFVLVLMISDSKKE